MYVPAVTCYTAARDTLEAHGARAGALYRGNRRSWDLSRVGGSKRDASRGEGERQRREMEAG